MRILAVPITGLAMKELGEELNYCYFIQQELGSESLVMPDFDILVSNNQ